MSEYAMPIYHTQPTYNVEPPRTTSTTETPSHPYRGFRVMCGNGHRPISRIFTDHKEAYESAYTHNMFVHNDIRLGFGIADVTPVFVNIP